MLSQRHDLVQKLQTAQVDHRMGRHPNLLVSKEAGILKVVILKVVNGLNISGAMGRLHRGKGMAPRCTILQVTAAQECTETRVPLHDLGKPDQERLLI